MASNVSYSPKAIDDLNELWNYVARELSSPGDADSLIDRIMDRVDALAKYPELGTPLSALCDTRASYRFVVEGNWMAFYHVASGNVFVDRVLYGRSDYIQELLG